MLTTSQNYVRCIKPNGIRKPDAFDGHFVLRQLRYTGVGAVVAIQRSGYPISMSHSEFVGRYRCIALDRPKLLQGSAKEAARDGGGGWSGGSTGRSPDAGSDLSGRDVAPVTSLPQLEL